MTLPTGARTVPPSVRCEQPAGFRGVRGNLRLQRIEARELAFLADIGVQRHCQVRAVQIAVEVEGKTYYGCCEMCKGRLTSDAKLRSAVDPVSQKPVDKADAVIAADSKGKVFYFENDENLAAYNAKVAK